MEVLMMMGLKGKRETLMNGFVYKILVVLLVFGTSRIHANLNFAASSASITFKSPNSRLRFNKAAQVQGWSGRSIIKETGNNAANEWIEAYQDDSVISLANGTQVPQ